MGAALLASSALVIVGVEGTMKYAIDAPWRIVLGAIRDGAPGDGPGHTPSGPSREFTVSELSDVE